MDLSVRPRGFEARSTRRDILFAFLGGACKAVEVRLPEVLDVFIPRQSKLRSQNSNQRDVNKPMCVMFFDSRLMRSVYNRTQPAFGKRPQGIAP